MTGGGKEAITPPPLKELGGDKACPKSTQKFISYHSLTIFPHPLSESHIHGGWTDCINNIKCIMIMDKMSDKYLSLREKNFAQLARLQEMIDGAIESGEI